MQTQIFFEESKRFLKENKKRILLFTILGAVLFATFTAANLIINNKKSSGEDLSLEEVKNMAEFSIYIEKKDEIAFNNIALLEEILFSEKEIKKAELETGIEISDILLAQEEKEFMATAEDRGVLGVLRNVTNEVLQFQVKIGTKKENMKIANYYFEKIKNNEVEVLKDKNIYILSSPETKQLSQETVTMIEETNENLSPLVLIVQLVVSLFVGSVLGILFSIFYHVFNKKINYTFNYNINENDIFIMERNSEDKLIYDIINPIDDNKIVLVEEALSNKFSNKISKKSEKVALISNILEISPETETAEIVILIIEKTTAKSWYNTQREYLKKFDSTIKIIQVPESIFRLEK